MYRDSAPGHKEETKHCLPIMSEKMDTNHKVRKRSRQNTASIRCDWGGKNQKPWIPSLLAVRVDAHELWLHVPAGDEQFGVDDVAHVDIGPVLFGGALEGHEGERGVVGRPDVHAEGVSAFAHHHADHVLASRRDVPRRNSWWTFLRNENCAEFSIEVWLES